MKLMKLLVFVNAVALILLSLFIAVAVVQTETLKQKYGFSYEVTTVIEGESSTRTVTLLDNVVAIVFLSLLFLLMVVNIGVILSKREEIVVPIN